MSSRQRNEVREPLVHLTKRASTSPARAWAIRAIAIFLGLLVCGIVAFLLTQYGKFGYRSPGNQSFPESDLIGNKHPALPMTVKIVNAVNSGLLKILQAAHDPRFNSTQLTCHISHSVSPPF